MEHSTLLCGRQSAAVIRCTNHFSPVAWLGNSDEKYYRRRNVDTYDIKELYQSGAFFVEIHFTKCSAICKRLSVLFKTSYLISIPAKDENNTARWNIMEIFLWGKIPLVDAKSIRAPAIQRGAYWMMYGFKKKTLFISGMASKCRSTWEISRFTIEVRWSLSNEEYATPFQK